MILVLSCRFFGCDHHEWYKYGYECVHKEGTEMA